MREIVFGLTIAVATTLAAFALTARPVPGRPVVALFAPGTSTAAMAQAVAQAGGSLIRLDTGSASAVTIAPSPSFAADLYKRGAWLVLDGSLAPLCAALGGRGTA